MSTREIKKNINKQIKNENTFVRVDDENKRSTVAVHISDKNIEEELKKENGYFLLMGGSIFAVCSVFFHLWYSAVLPSSDPFQGNDVLADLLIGGGIALTSFFTYLRMKKNYPRIKRGVFAFNRTKLFEIFKNYDIEETSKNLKNILLATDSNLEDQNKVICLFAEHFCNILEVSEISRIIDSSSTASLSSEVMEVKKNQIIKAIENLSEDPRYIEILNEYKSDKTDEMTDPDRKREYNPREYGCSETLKIA